MSSIRVLIVALMVLFLTAFSACKKDEAKDANAPAEAKADAAKADEAKADAAKADEAKADEAKAEAPKADEAKPADGKAASVDKVVDIFNKLGAAAKEANGDCDKLGANMSAVLNANRDALIAGMKDLADISEESPEGKRLGAALENVIGDNSEVGKQLNGCENNASVDAFKLGMLGVIMAAAPAEPEAAAPAPAPEAAPAAAPADAK